MSKKPLLVFSRALAMAALPCLPAHAAEPIAEPVEERLVAQARPAG